MSRLIVVFLCICMQFYSFAQNTFELLISDDRDQEIYHLVEDSSGNYVLAGKIMNDQTNFYDGYLIKINAEGELLNESIFHDETGESFFFNIHFVDGSFCTLGQIFFETQSYYSANLWQMQLNQDLVVTNESLNKIPNDRWFSYMKSIIDSDTNIVFTGYTTRPDTSGPSPIPYNHDPFFYKLSLSGDSISSKFMSLPFKLTLSTDIIEKSETPGYFAFGNDFFDIPLTGQRFELSKNFDSLNVVATPLRIRGYFSSAMINDTSILICGQGGPETTPSYSLNVLTHTEDNTPIDYNYFKIEGSMRDHPAFLYSLGKNGDNTFVGGTSNFDYSNPFYSSFDSWYHLVKINPDLSPVWEYWYGGDAYYHLYSIAATNDGGCIMVGNRYDDETKNPNRDIYILKVNEEGLLVSTSEKPTEGLHEVLVFPNPGNNYLKVRIAVQVKQCTIELYDMNGKRLLSEQIQGQWGEMNTSSLIPGTYIYRIYNDEGLFESGKWVKQ
jgi:hypothetical protein